MEGKTNMFPVPKRNVIGELGEGGQLVTSVLNQNKFLSSAGIVTSLRLVSSLLSSVQFVLQVPP